MAMKSTKEAIKAICGADPSINPAQIKAALAELDGSGVGEMKTEPPPRSYTPAQVAALLGRTRRAVSMYARRGLITPIYSGAKGKRAQGYTGDSVAAFLTGKVSIAVKGGKKDE